MTTQYRITDEDFIYIFMLLSCIFLLYKLVNQTQGFKLRSQLHREPRYCKKLQINMTDVATIAVAKTP